MCVIQLICFEKLWNLNNDTGNSLFPFITQHPFSIFFRQNTIYIQLFFFLIKKKPHSTKTFPNSQYFYNSNNERFFPGLIYDMSTFTYVFHRNVSASFWHDQHLQLKRENNIIVLELLLLRKLCRFGICIEQPELFKTCVIFFTV